MSGAYAILVPARWASKRLPGKVLLAETGKPLVQHVVERALRAPGAPRVLVLTDDDRVEQAVLAFGGEVVRTSPRHRSGTDRCAEAAPDTGAPVLVNLQADEPLVEPEDLARLAEAAADPIVDIATLAHPFADIAHKADTNAVKAIVGRDGFARDFRREPPGGVESREVEVLHHVGIYAWRLERLLAFSALPPSPRETAERLEQLRALENGWRIRVLPASRPALGIDTRADYDAFLRELDMGSGGS